LELAGQASQDSFIRQLRKMRQQVVVCKIPSPAPCGAEVIRLQRLSRKLSCCLQDRPLHRSKAKLLLPNVLGSKLRCCLQDPATAAYRPGPADFPVLSNCIGVLFAVTFPVIGILAAPFPGTVPAYLAVFFVCFQLLPAVFGPPPLLASRLTANCLLRLVLRGLESFLTIAATPFSHMARFIASRQEAKNLETEM